MEMETMPRPFLTARWVNLCLWNYAVSPALLQKRLPPGLVLDTRDGWAFVSLVAFQFVDTRVLGVAWPGYRAFAELNLRYYVRHGSCRGIVFIREIVSERLVAWLAWLLYHEPYRVAPFRATVSETASSLGMEFRLTWAGRPYRLAMTGGKPAGLPPEASDEHFFKEHRWGFGIDRRGRTIRYEVQHPAWEVLPVQEQAVELDWTEVYGPEWGVLNDQPPHSVVMAVGSPVVVFAHGRLGRP
jgi:uncharacterized protein YqjF (DUF2071 family)